MVLRHEGDERGARRVARNEGLTLASASDARAAGEVQRTTQKRKERVDVRQKTGSAESMGAAFARGRAVKRLWMGEDGHDGEHAPATWNEPTSEEEAMETDIMWKEPFGDG